MTKTAMTTFSLSSYIWIFLLSSFEISTQSTSCSHTKFTPYKCHLLPQSNDSLRFPCKVENIFGCQYFKAEVPPKDLHLDTILLVGINVYNLTYSHEDEYFYGETYPALNFTISLPNHDMLEFYQGIRVNIWNNVTSSVYGKDGICRLFNFDLSTLLKKNNQTPAYINHKCFTAIMNNRYSMKFTTLPYATEITYNIAIKEPNKVILAVAPVHHWRAVSIVLGFPVNNICKNKFRLTNFKTATENIKYLINNSFLFEDLQPGFYRVRVESSCFAIGQNMESEIIQLKDLSESATNGFDERVIWIFLSLIPSVILISYLYWYYLWKKKCIDRSHKCIIDLLYSSNIKTSKIVAEHLTKLMEEEFEWCVNNVPLDFSISCSCDWPTNNVSLYLTASDSNGKIMVPDQHKIFQDIQTSENGPPLINALLYYKPNKSRHPICTEFQPSFDIVKNIKKLFYFVYRESKSQSPVQLFDETHYPKVINRIEKFNFWKRFVDFIEHVAQLNDSHQNAYSVTQILTSSYDDDDDTYKQLS